MQNVWSGSGWISYANVRFVGGVPHSEQLEPVGSCIFENFRSVTDTMAIG